MSANSWISDSGLSSLKGLKSLETLYVRGDITDEGVASIVQHTSMRVLYLITNKEGLSDKALECIASFVELRVLYVGAISTEFTDKGILQLGLLKNIEKLTIQGCKNVEGTGFASLLDNKLHYLSIEGCPLTDEGIEVIGKFSCIDRLHIHDSEKLTAKGIRILAKIPRLRHLIFWRCTSITDSHLPIFERSGNLRSLLFFDCPNLTNSKIEELDKRLQFCRVGYNS